MDSSHEEELIDSNVIQVDKYEVRAAYDNDDNQKCISVVPGINIEMEAIDGIVFDFNEGLRIKFPKTGGPWRVVFTDVAKNLVVYDANVEANAIAQSFIKYYSTFKFTIYRDKEDTAAFEYTFDPTGKDILIELGVDTLGDPLAWFPYVEQFRVKHKCNVFAMMMDHMIALLEKQYPEIRFVTPEQVKTMHPYATYYLGAYFDSAAAEFQPCDFRLVGLQQSIAYQLGLEPVEIKPRLDLSAPRQISEPYVCIATQSTAQCKYWNHPYGWLQVIEFLKKAGYRVLCIDQYKVYGTKPLYNRIPFGCEDFTGELSLQERVNLLKDADFFIGLGSGLSWLAWACNVPVVMISGFSHPVSEFYTPYRVINFNVCNSCWNDLRVTFDHEDYMWCPRHKDDEEQFACTMYITPEMVYDVIKKVPAFQRLTSGECA